VCLKWISDDDFQFCFPEVNLKHVMNHFFFIFLHYDLWNSIYYIISKNISSPKAIDWFQNTFMAKVGFSTRLRKKCEKYILLNFSQNGVWFFGIPDSFHWICQFATAEVNNCINFEFTKLFCQQMHSLLKHKMLQLILKISLFMAPTCFGPFGPWSGSIRQDLAKVTVFVELLVKIHR
jgi:hypothetical protein